MKNKEKTLIVGVELGKLLKKMGLKVHKPKKDDDPFGVKSNPNLK